MQQHLRLLQVGPGGLAGPLAEVIGREASKRPLLLKALRGLSRLTPSKRIELLGLFCEVDDDGRFGARPTGLLGAKMGADMAETVRNWVNNKGWAIARKDGRLVFTMYQPALPSQAALKAFATRRLYEKTGHPRASTATLQITAKCQADCEHCSAARHKYQARTEMTADQWKSVIRQTEDLGVVNVVFTGGEPLLRKDIYELISWVRKDEANAMMFTNGLLLTEENVKKLVDAGLFSLNVSIDSPDPESHDRLRRVPRCFERAIEGLNRAKEAGLIVGISTYATPERLHSGEVAQMIELARDVGAHELTVFDVVPTGRLLQQDAALLLSESDKQEIIRIEQEWNRKRELPHIISQSFINGPMGSGCFAGWFQFYMTAYGDMMPCDFTPLTVGNATEESVETLWDRLVAHPMYAGHCNHCRMQDPEFRAKYIDLIPDEGPFPFPIHELDKAREERRPVVSAPRPEGQRSSVGVRG
ncbi:MAG: radical SAM protein [Armatimonadota bacterium]|nr:radical SAM protein [Armatimonadota bacterium]